MHTRSASRELMGNRPDFVVAVVAIAAGAVGIAVVMVVGRDVKTIVRVTADESFSGLRVYDAPALIDTFEVCGSFSQTSRVL